MSVSPKAGFPRFRVGLAVIGLVVLALLVQHVGAKLVLEMLRTALPWLPILGVLDVFRIGCETTASYVAYGDVARRIPPMTLFRAHVLGHSLGSVAPAPTVVKETIKATLLTPYVGAGAATAVAFINQAAILISVGLFSAPCALAILALEGRSLWFWACVVHSVAIVSCGLLLQVVTRANAPARWLVKKLPRLEARARAFRTHASGTGLFAMGPTAALLVGRCVQVLQYGVAALAVGIDPTFLRAMATQGVNLVASAVGVLIPAGLGATDGAFTLAAGVLGTTAARATSLALLLRCNQIVWVFIGSAVALFGPRKPGGLSEA